jgi:hypothetical protein
MNSAQLILVTLPIRCRLETWLPSQALERIEAAVMHQRLELRSGPLPPRVCSAAARPTKVAVPREWVPWWNSVNRT